VTTKDNFTAAEALRTFPDVEPVPAIVADLVCSARGTADGDTLTDCCGSHADHVFAA